MFVLQFIKVKYLQKQWILPKLNDSLDPIDEDFHLFPNEEPIFDEEEHVVAHVVQSLPFRERRQVEHGFPQRQGVGAKALPGRILRLEGFLEGQVGLARERARPHEAVAHDDALEELAGKGESVVRLGISSSRT